MSTPLVEAIEILEACTATTASSVNVATLTSVVAACIQIADAPNQKDDLMFRLVMRLQARGCDDTARDILFAGTNCVASLYEGTASHMRVVRMLSLLESAVSARLERPLSIAS